MALAGTAELVKVGVSLDMAHRLMSQYILHPRECCCLVGKLFPHQVQRSGLRHTLQGSNRLC